MTTSALGITQNLKINLSTGEVLSACNAMRGQEWSTCKPKKQDFPSGFFDLSSCRAECFSCLGIYAFHIVVASECKLPFLLLCEDEPTGLPVAYFNHVCWKPKTHPKSKGTRTEPAFYWLAARRNKVPRNAWHREAREDGFSVHGQSIPALFLGFVPLAE